MTIKINSAEQLFATKVVVSEDSSFPYWKNDLINWMLDYSNEQPSNVRSNYGGYQSPDDFYLEESFTPYLNRISEHIVSTIEEYAKDTILDHEKVRLCNMWFNLNYKNCYNVTHTHPGCLLAGVLWIQMPDQTPIKFEDPLSYCSSEITLNANRNYTPKEGQMCLFPAWIPHRVDINETDATRISLSFNLVNS